MTKDFDVKVKELGFYPINSIEPGRLLGRGIAVRSTFEKLNLR